MNTYHYVGSGVTVGPLLVCTRGLENIVHHLVMNGLADFFVRRAHGFVVRGCENSTAEVDSVRLSSISNASLVYGRAQNQDAANLGTGREHNHLQLRRQFIQGRQRGFEHLAVDLDFFGDVRLGFVY